MYNRYNGMTGRYERVSDPEPAPRRPMSVPRRQSPPGWRAASAPRPGQAAQKGPPPARGGGQENTLLGSLGSILPLGKLQDAVSGILPRVLQDGLETEDLLLLAVLYLMYKESGDRELLIILGAMFLL